MSGCMMTLYGVGRFLLYNINLTVSVTLLEIPVRLSGGYNYDSATVDCLSKVVKVRVT